jgi:NAD(P)H dehydrogenase (quinone)
VILQVVRAAIAYYSARGHTRKLASAVTEGVGEVKDATADLIPLNALTTDSWVILENAHALIFGSPTYMGGVSSVFKKFAEQTLEAFADNQRWQEKVAAGFTHSQAMSGDKLHTLQYFTILAAQHGMIWVNLDLRPGWCSAKGSVADMNRLGSWLGAMSQSNGDAPLEESPNAGDLATARHLGRRAANVARQLLVGRKTLCKGG